MNKTQAYRASAAATAAVRAYRQVKARKAFRPQTQEKARSLMRWIAQKQFILDSKALEYVDSQMSAIDMLMESKERNERLWGVAWRVYKRLDSKIAQSGSTVNARPLAGVLQKIAKGGT